MDDGVYDTTQATVTIGEIVCKCWTWWPGTLNLLWWIR